MPPGKDGDVGHGVEKKPRMMLRRIDAVGRNDPARGCLSSEAVSGASSEVARRNRSGRIAPEPLQGDCGGLGSGQLSVPSVWWRTRRSQVSQSLLTGRMGHLPEPLGDRTPIACLKQPARFRRCPPGPDQLPGVGRSPGRRHTWWVSPFGGISARRVAGWRVRIDLVGALEFSVQLAAGGSRFGVTCLRLVL